MHVILDPRPCDSSRVTENGAGPGNKASSCIRSWLTVPPAVDLALGGDGHGVSVRAPRGGQPAEDGAGREGAHLPQRGLAVAVAQSQPTVASLVGGGGGRGSRIGLAHYAG